MQNAAIRRAKGELAQARQASLASQQEYRSAQLRLAELSGWPAEPLPKPVGELDHPKPAPPLEELVAIALAEHPGIASRASAVAEAETRVQLESREAWPEPSIGVTYTRESLPIAGLHEHIVQGAMTVPIPFTQRNQSGRAQARAERSIAKAEERAFVQSR